MDKDREVAKKLSTERGNLIVKRNDFIQKSRHQLSLQEQKIVLYIISKVKPDDINFTEQSFSISEFCQVCGIHEVSGKNYSDVKEALGKLLSRYVWVKNENGSETSLRWIDKATINKHSGIIQLRLDSDLKPFLLMLEEHYTLYELRYTLAMKSKYSVRLYELLKSYSYKKYVVFDIDELKRLLFAENYKMNNHFKDKVLDIAVREINELSDISVDYSFQKEGRKFARVAFSIDRKEAYDRWVAGLAVDKKKK